MHRIISLALALVYVQQHLVITKALHVDRQQLEQQVKTFDVASAESVSAYVRELEKYNYLVGIIAIGVERENYTKCGQELDHMLKAINGKELWAVRVLDSFGQAPRTFTWGNYFWFSSQELCDDLNDPHAISFSKQQQKRHPNFFNITSPFPMRYQIAYMKFETPHYIDLKLPFENLVHIGLCLPQSCNSSALLNYTDAFFRSEVFEMQRNFQIKLKPQSIKTPHFSWTYLTRTGSIIFIILAALVVLVCTLAELQYRYERRLRKKHHHLHLKFTQSQPEVTDRTLGEHIIACFCVRSNYKRLITLEQKNGKFLSAIAGLRTIICLWVTVFHVYYYSLYAMTNAPMIFAKLEHLILQPVIMACFYVDVFFVISAFLLVYNFLSNQKQMQTIRFNGCAANTKLLLRSIFRRYMRLTPVMIVTLLISNMVSDFINMFTPFLLGPHSGIYCKDNWWYNLLYLHNLLGMKDICCSWTWYLGCEMQYFLLFTILLYAYAKYPQLLKIIYTALVMGFVVIGWMCNYRNGITFQIDVIYGTLDELYVKPWVRIIPYCGGALMGWLLAYWHGHVQRNEQEPAVENDSSSNSNRGTMGNTHATSNSSNSSGYCCGSSTTTAHSCTGSSYNCSASASTSTSTSTSSSSSNSDDDGAASDSGKCIQLRAVWLAAFWFVCVCLYVTTNFMSYWRSTPIWLVSTIMSFGKLLFSLCIGGVIILCAQGKAGPLNVLLSARLFLFFNKLCYSMYMIAPAIIFGAYGLRNEATPFSEVGSAIDFMGIILITIAGACLLVILIELPMQRLAEVLLKRDEIGRQRKDLTMQQHQEQIPKWQIKC